MNKKKKTKTNSHIALLVIFACVLFGTLALVGWHLQDETKDLAWMKSSNGVWVVEDAQCLEQTQFEYLCRSTCYESINQEIWIHCKKEGYMDETGAGIPVLCFSCGCVPKISNGGCYLVCPL